MKRIILAGLFALSTVAGAHADTSTYVWQGKGQWSDAELQAAAQVCDQRYGVVENGAVIIRVHDVAPTVQALAVAAAIRRAR